MNYKLEKSFQNSLFYRNYNNIGNVILKFQSIKNKYKLERNKYKNNSITIKNTLNKDKIKKIFLEKLNLYFYVKFSIRINKLVYQQYDKNINILDSCKIILENMIKISHSIGKYIKYSENINDDFVKSVKIGNVKIINSLIKNGANIHHKNDYALRFSSYNRNVNAVKFLIEKGADVHAWNDDALKWTSSEGFIELVKILVESGANIHADDEYALYKSSLNGRIEVVKYLVKMGADINADDDRALMISSNFGRTEVVKILVENGANIHARNDQALNFSSMNRHREIVKFLIQYDLDYYRSNEIGRNSVIECKLVEFYEKFNIR